MKKWYTLALFNLVVVTLLGLVLRYKINFDLPFIEQKNVLHAHSHFAFNGWLSFVLQLFLVEYFAENYKADKKFWDRFLLVSTVINYGMIITFSWKGYAPVSIVLSTLALWLSYVFAYKMFKSLSKANSSTSNNFIKAALFFLVLSSLGPYALAVLAITKSAHQFWYHNSLYFFLHFQYNGWFTFAIMGLLFKRLERIAAFNNFQAKKFFTILAITCVPSFLLSALFVEKPQVINIINVMTVFAQAISLLYLWKLLRNNYKDIFSQLPGPAKWLYALSILAFALKVILQLFSAHPQAAQVAFGFRPIIIGYLHLVFLVFASLFLLGLMIENQIINCTDTLAKNSVALFTIGVIFNEILLAIQGFASILFIYLPMTNLLLFINTFTMFFGAALLFRSALKTNRMEQAAIA